MRKLLALISVITLLSACIIENDIYFERNFSGYSETKFDLTMLFKTMAELQGDTVFASAEEEQAAMREFMLEFVEDGDELFAEIEKEVGKDNFSFSMDTLDLTMNMRIDFDNVEALNEIMLSSYETEAENKPEFFMQRNKKTFRIWVRPGDGESLELIKEYYTLHFKHKVKSCDFSGAEITDHTVKYTNKDLTEGRYLEIVLK